MNDIEHSDEPTRGEEPAAPASTSQGGPEYLPSPRGYSLASLFLLVTTAGVLAGLARNIGQTQTGSLVVSVHAGVGSFLGFLVGAMIGFGYPRRVRGMFLGAFVGWLTGGVCAALAAAGGSPWLFVLGAAALLALGFASRWIHRRELGP